MGEYIKAWFILHVIAKEFDLGAQDGFQFNISVGYDLAGIKEPKVNTFIDSMMEAKDTEIFKECKQWLLDNVDKFEKVTKEDIEAIKNAKQLKQYLKEKAVMLYEQKETEFPEPEQFREIERVVLLRVIDRK